MVSIRLFTRHVKIAFLVSPWSLRTNVFNAYRHSLRLKTRKEDLNAYFTASLQIRKFIISCCDNVRHWLWKQVPLIESRAFCRVWRLSRVALLIFYLLWFVVFLSFCANTKTHSTNLYWDFLVVSFYFIGKKGKALVTNRPTYPVDDVVEPEDEDYIDAAEG